MSSFQRGAIAAVLVMGALALSSQSQAQLNPKLKLSSTQQAAFGWIWANQAVAECGGRLAWRTSSGKPLTRNQAQKLLIKEGHARGAVQASLRDRGVGPLVQLDRWMRAVGLTPNAQNAATLLCQFAGKVAGKNHPVGRFLQE